jgi:hypothetical protein
MLSLLPQATREGKQKQPSCEVLLNNNNSAATLIRKIQYQMKKTLLIVASILLIVFLLGSRLVYTKFSGGKEERVWYARQLRYNFSARIDTVIMLRGNVGLGKIVCRLMEGKPNPAIEDSLNQQLKRHRSLRLLMPLRQNQLEFLIPGAEHYLPGDSLLVNSASNTISFFRNGTELSVHELSAMLEARGNPFTF